MNINETGARAIIAKRIATDIDDYAIKTYDDGFRWHLGASIIGEPCVRAIWYKYRWVRHEVRSGRMYRLLNRGQREEDRYIEFLLGTGWNVYTHEVPPKYDWDGIHPPKLADKGKQYRVSWLHGHFGGSLDGVGEAPAAYQLSDPMLLEFKTKGTGKGFNMLMSKGVAKTDAVHWAQSCTYGYGKDLKYGVYFSTNKNDDDMHVELTALDHNVGKQMVNKAERIITSQTPPERISDNPLYDECKINCRFSDICHSGKPVEKNCRSCVKCVPTENAEFFCTAENAVIPRDIVRQGCGGHESINVITKKIIEIKPIQSEVTGFEIENVPLPE